MNQLGNTGDPLYIIIGIEAAVTFRISKGLDQTEFLVFHQRTRMYLKHLGDGGDRIDRFFTWRKGFDLLFDNLKKNIHAGIILSINEAVYI